MNFRIIIIAFVFFMAFIGMSAYALYVNDDWAHEYGKLNKEWFEFARAQTNEWTEFCSKIENENNALKKRIKELESKTIIEAEE